MGPLVSTEQHERVLGYIDAGRKEGASVLCGGDAPGGDGYFVNPTVLVDVKPEMKVVREEIFGPVLAAPALRRSRRGRQGGQRHALRPRRQRSGPGTSRRCTSSPRKLKAGMVWGNCHSATDPSLPFGGYKQSGFGRESGRYGVEAYTEIKTVAIAL